MGDRNSSVCLSGAKLSPGAAERVGQEGCDTDGVLEGPTPNVLGFRGLGKTARSLKPWGGFDVPNTQPTSLRLSARRFALSDPSCLLTLMKTSA